MNRKRTLYGHRNIINMQEKMLQNVHDCPLCFHLYPFERSLRVQLYRASLSTHLPTPLAILEHERNEACETTVGLIQPLCCMHHNTTQGQELDVIPLVPVASA